ncbi:MAG: prepilin peptidase [[Clostridium] scindens]
MWEISQVFCMGILLSLSVIDIHFRRIPVDILVMASIAALVYQGITRQADLWMAAGGAGVGILFLLVSKVTREGFGYGDSWAILALGIYLGLWGVLDVLAGTFCLLAAASLICLTAKKMSRKTYDSIHSLSGGRIFA